MRKKILTMLIGACALCGLSGCEFSIGKEVPLGDVIEETTQADTTTQSTAIEQESDSTQYDDGKGEERENITDNTENNTSSADALEDEGFPKVITSDIEEMLKNTQSDYNKVVWGSKYSLFSEYPEIVISVTPYTNDGTPELIVGITNLLSTPISFAGKASAISESGDEVGNNYIYESCIGMGETAIEEIRCMDGIPDGRILWTETSITDSLYEHATWTATYQATGNPQDGKINVDYTVTADGGKLSLVNVLMLDENGYVVGIATDYPNGLSGTATTYGSSDVLQSIKDCAFFVTPYIP